MLIHEMFAPIQEVNWGKAAKQIGSTIVQAPQKALAQRTGTSIPTADNPYAGPGAEDKAKIAAEPIIKAQAKEQAKLWLDAIQQAMAADRVTSMDQIGSARQMNLSKNLNQQLHNGLLQNKLGNNYKDLPKMVNSAFQTQAAKTVRDIETAYNTIMDLSKKRDAATIEKEWETLSRAVADAMRMVEFHGGSSGNPSRPAAATATSNKQLQATMTALGLTPQSLVTLNSIVKQSGQKVNPAGTGSQVLDDLLKAAKLL